MNLRLLAAGIAVAFSGALVVASPASAEPITATANGSTATVNTPLYLPGEYDCAKYPLSFNLEPDMNFATITMVDAFGSSIASDLQMKPGSGSTSLQVCGFQIKGNKGPYTLTLEMSYGYESGKPDQTGISPAFMLTSKAGAAISCKKTKAPSKGQVKKFKTSKCPSGWKKV